jgi:Tol biopolymer transport system component
MRTRALTLFGAAASFTLVWTIGVTPATATMAGANGRIAYSQALPDGGALVFTAAADGSDTQQVPLPYLNEDWGRAVWSPDGSTLLLSNVLRFDSNGDLLPFRPGIVRPDGSDFRLLDMPGNPFDAYCAAWSPDGTRLLCGLGLDQPGLFSLRVSDGGDPVRLTTTPAGYGDASGDYSPDGSQVVFVRQKEGTARNAGQYRDSQAALFVVDTDGTAERQLTPYGFVRAHEQASVAWSPDGSTILSSTRDGRLFTVHPDGSGLDPIQLQVGTGDYFAYGAGYSPDGTRIAFTLNQDCPADIYTANLDGSGVEHLTADPAPERFPDWAPTGH